MGQALAAIAAVLLLRLFSGPSMLLENEDGDVADPIVNDDGDVADPIVDDDGDEGIEQGRVYPAAIRWRNFTCSLSDKSSNTVKFRFLIN